MLQIFLKICAHIQVIEYYALWDELRSKYGSGALHTLMLRDSVSWLPIQEHMDFNEPDREAWELNGLTLLQVVPITLEQLKANSEVTEGSGLVKSNGYSYSKWVSGAWEWALWYLGPRYQCSFIVEYCPPYWQLDLGLLGLIFQDVRNSDFYVNLCY